MNRLHSSTSLSCHTRDNWTNTLCTPAPGFLAVPVPTQDDCSIETFGQVSEPLEAVSSVTIRSLMPMMVFAVLGVIVCDLKALGMATCMGGGSSKTQFHCIWNSCRR